MPPMKITIQVDERTGDAYQQATPEQRRRAEKRAERSLQHALMTRQETVEKFRRLTTSIGEEAEAAGWTDEMNKALLRGDYD